MDRAQQDDEGGENSGKTMHQGAPCVFAGAIGRATALVGQTLRWAEARSGNP